MARPLITLPSAMPLFNLGGPDRRFPDLAKSAIDELTTLIGAQSRLLRLEVLADLRQVGRRLVGLAVFAPLVLVGYIFVLLGVAHLLRDWLGLGAALLIIGGVHVLGAGIGLYVAIQRLSGVQALERTREEIKTTVQSVTAAAAPSDTQERPALQRPLLEGSSHG